MKRFALSQNIAMGREPMDTLNHTYVQWCERIEIQPLLIPNAISNLAQYMDELEVQGVILTGGNDISGLRPFSKESSEAPIRDRVEEVLLKTALERGLPVIGICRGMQFLNVYFGGKLLHNLSESAPAYDAHAGRRHEIQITRDEIAAYLGVRSYSVNSFHNHGITIDRVAPALDVFAVTEADHIVEGLIHPNKQILGLQWHPERPGSPPEYDILLMAGFLQGTLWTTRRR